jgi:hypothetical protein
MIKQTTPKAGVPAIKQWVIFVIVPRAGAQMTWEDAFIAFWAAGE